MQEFQHVQHHYCMQDSGAPCCNCDFFGVIKQGDAWKLIFSLFQDDYDPRLVR